MNELPKTIKPGQELEVQLAPHGEYPCRDGHPEHEGKLQRVTPEAVSRMVGNYGGELLVDLDHMSEITPKTEAAAWVTGLRADPERGLMGTLKFTDTGAAAVSARRYRYTSAAWEVDAATGEPVRLCSVALTNKPNLPVAPVLNAARGGTAATPETNQNEKQKESKMEKLKELLGLAPEATDDDVAAAVAGMKKKLDELAEKAAEAEAESFAAENKDKVEDLEALKNAYLENPGMARALVANIKAPPKAPAVCNSAAGRAPAMRSSARAGLVACKSPEERVAYITAHGAELAADND